jgi:hypothetical protein
MKFEEFRKKFEIKASTSGDQATRRYSRKIEREIIPKEFVTISDYLRHLIREDMKKRGAHPEF